MSKYPRGSSFRLSHQANPEKTLGGFRARVRDLKTLEDWSKRFLVDAGPKSPFSRLKGPSCYGSVPEILQP